MVNIIKGIFALPIIAVIVCGVFFVGSVVVSGIALLVTLLGIALPFLLRVAAILVVILGTLWLAGAVATAVQTSINKQ